MFPKPPRRPIYNIYSNPDDSINRDVSEAA